MAKGGSKKKDSKKKAPVTDNGAPKIVAMKGGLTKAQLVQEAIFKMEDDLRISKKQAADFALSLEAVIEEQLGEGNPVNLFGLVKLVPRLHTKGQRQVNEIFGDPESKKVTKKYPAKISLKATVAKAAKDMLPSVQKLQKKVA